MNEPTPQALPPPWPLPTTLTLFVAYVFYYSLSFEADLRPVNRTAVKLLRGLDPVFPAGRTTRLFLKCSTCSAFADCTDRLLLVALAFDGNPHISRLLRPRCLPVPHNPPVGRTEPRVCGNILSCDGFPIFRVL